MGLLGRVEGSGNICNPSRLACYGRLIWNLYTPITYHIQHAGLPVGPYHTPFLVTLFWALDLRTMKLGTLNKGYGMSPQVYFKQDSDKEEEGKGRKLTLCPLYRQEGPKEAHFDVDFLRPSFAFLTLKDIHESKERRGIDQHHYPSPPQPQALPRPQKYVKSGPQTF